MLRILNLDRQRSCLLQRGVDRRGLAVCYVERDPIERHVPRLIEDENGVVARRDANERVRTVDRAIVIVTTWTDRVDRGAVTVDRRQVRTPIEKRLIIAGEHDIDTT